MGTLHHLADHQDPAGLMATYVDALPPGSYVMVSHFHNPGDGDPELAGLAARLEHAFLGSPMGTGRFRSRDDIAGYVAGCAPVVASDNGAIATLPEAEQGVVRGMLGEITTAYDHRRTFYGGDKLRAVIRDYVEALGGERDAEFAAFYPHTWRTEHDGPPFRRWRGRPPPGEELDGADLPAFATRRAPF